jgi:hypothetical protein
MAFANRTGSRSGFGLRAASRRFSSASAGLAFGLGLAQGGLALLLRQARGFGFGLEAGCFSLGGLAGCLFTARDLGLAALLRQGLQAIA